MMDVQEAVRIAKLYALELFKDDGVINFGLEEVEYLPKEDEWRITVGFSRPWSSAKTTLSQLTGEPSQKRLYRVVRVDSKGNVLSVKRRDVDDSFVNP